MSQDHRGSGRGGGGGEGGGGEGDGESGPTRPAHRIWGPHETNLAFGAPILNFSHEVKKLMLYKSSLILSQYSFRNDF